MWNIWESREMDKELVGKLERKSHLENLGLGG
jgi:hypothetical protein